MDSALYHNPSKGKKSKAQDKKVQKHRLYLDFDKSISSIRFSSRSVMTKNVSNLVSACLRPRNGRAGK